MTKNKIKRTSDEVEENLARQHHTIATGAVIAPCRDMKIQHNAQSTSQPVQILKSFPQIMQFVARLLNASEKHIVFLKVPREAVELDIQAWISGLKFDKSSNNPHIGNLKVGECPGSDTVLLDDFKAFTAEMNTYDCVFLHGTEQWDENALHLPKTIAALARHVKNTSKRKQIVIFPYADGNHDQILALRRQVGKINIASSNIQMDFVPENGRHQPNEDTKTTEIDFGQLLEKRVDRLREFVAERTEKVIEAHKDAPLGKLRDYFKSGNSLQAESEKLVRSLEKAVAKSGEFEDLSCFHSDFCRGAVIDFQPGILNVINERLSGNDLPEPNEVAEFVGIGVLHFNPKKGLPPKAPRIYRGLKADGPPLKFAKRVYSPWIEMGVLDKSELERLDPNLVKSIYNFNEAHNRKAGTLKKILPHRMRALENRLSFYSH